MEQLIWVSVNKELHCIINTSLDAQPVKLTWYFLLSFFFSIGKGTSLAVNSYQVEYSIFFCPQSMQLRII